MRALLLLVLGAGLVWFVWRGVGPGGKDEATEAAAPGTMIQVEAAPAGGETVPPAAPADAAAGGQAAADAESPPEAGVASIVPDAAPPPQPEPEQPATPVPTAAAPERPTSPAAEATAGSALLRDPDGFCGWLDLQTEGLSSGRKALAQAYGHALAGRAAEAATALATAAPDSGEVKPGERELAQRLAAREAAPSRLLPRESALSLAAGMVALDRQAAAALEAGRAAEAAQGFSSLLLAELEAPWPSDTERLRRWTDALREAQAAHRWSRKGAWPSASVRVEGGDSLISVRKRAIATNPGLLVCTGLIARANQLSGETIHPGQDLRIPLDRARMLVDLDAHWACFLLGDEVAAAWPIGVGREGNETQVGTFTVGEKTPNPMWFPRGRAPVPHGDPENPLGSRWIAWLGPDGQKTGLGFHGTTEPESIGRDASQGCIRMRDQDVEELFEILPVGARVDVRP